MEILKKIARKIPDLPLAYHKSVNLIFRRPSTEGIFSDIYIGNKFLGKDSVSGPGSDTDQTQALLAALPNLFSEFNIRTILDIPCGDFYWMQHVNLDGINYIGGDIVAKLIQKNKQRYEKNSIGFSKLNLITDKLPKVDLILCRDCLVHLSFNEIFDALRNVCESGSSYFLTTTFVDRKSNADIATGMWRTLNLQTAPFMFPAPLKLIDEKCTENGGDYKDKSLGLWRVTDIRNCLSP